MPRTYYPVTAAEIGHAVTRSSDHSDCTIAVRELFTDDRGRSFPMLAYGHPAAYEYVRRNGKVYAVYRYDDPGERVFAE